LQTDSTEEQNHSVLRSKRDADLLRLYAEQRSEEAFAELGRRYTRLIFATCLRETQNRTLAEDASQGVFLLLSQKAGSLKRTDSLAGWLYTAARYLSQNLIKQERRRERNEARAMQEESLSLPISGNPLWEQIEPHFHAALDRLKPADRVAILLRYVQNESLAEVGRRLGIPENTARMRINRAMEKIRAHLAHVGIGVSVAVLAALLEERSVQALPVTLLAAQNLPSAPSASPSQSTRVAARRTIRLLLLLALRFPFCLLLGTVLLVVGALLFHRLQSERWTPAEQHRLFTSLRGDWTGTLDFVDDTSKQHFTTPTTVVFDTQNGDNILRFIATYPRSNREDITTLSGDPRTGVFVADNGGPRRSHKLHSTGDLIKLGTNEFAFRGWSYPQNADVRLRISLATTRVSIYEEYRKQGQSDYQFRNRFLLHRSTPLRRANNK
jgi:RNA polymerase sigma factor (sigma-70 family)